MMTVDNHGPTNGQLPHRLRQVRENAGVTLRALARRMKRTSREVRAIETSADVSLADLLDWQRALKVPIAELLEPTGLSLSGDVRHRACLIRVAKTAHSLAKEVTTESGRCLARMLIDQLEELMPELSEIGPWHEVGARRTERELGRIAQNPLSTDTFLSMLGD